MLAYMLGIVTVTEMFLGIKHENRQKKEEKEALMEALARSVAADSGYSSRMQERGLDDATALLSVPRLFMYSEADKLILADLVEDYIEGLKGGLERSGLRPTFTSKLITTVKCPFSPHMMIGAYSPPLLDHIHLFVAANTGDRNTESPFPAKWNEAKQAFLEYYVNQSQRST